MLLDIIRKNPPLRQAYIRLSQHWIQPKLATVLPHLQGRILDIGSGNNLITQYLQELGFETTPLDVAPLSILPHLPTQVYDGENMPFPEQSFDTGLLLTVLHHTPNPSLVLQEALRVCKQVIIIEDIYRHPLQQYLTYGMDTLVNLGHSNMTYQNKDDAGWKGTFQTLNASLLHEQQKRVLFFFRQATYLVKARR